MQKKSNQNNHLFLFKKCTPIAIVLALVWMSGIAFADTIPVIGLDPSGNPALQEMSESFYNDSLKTMVSAVQDSLTPVLESFSMKDSNQAAGTLRTVSIGLTLTPQAGLGPIWSISGIARLRVIFSNSTSPVYPD